MNVGYASFKIGLKDAETRIADIKLSPLMLRSGLSRSMLSIDAIFGKGEVLGRGVNQLYTDYTTNSTTSITIYGMEFGASEISKFDLFRKIIIHGM